LTGSALKVLGVPQTSKDAESPLSWSVLFWVNGTGVALDGCVIESIMLSVTTCVRLGCSVGKKWFLLGNI
jgi:hypothetical protein